MQNLHGTIVSRLLEGRASTNLRDAAGRLPLHCLASKRSLGDEQLEITKQLIENLRLIEDTILVKDRDGWTPAHEAALAGNHFLLRSFFEKCDSHTELLQVTPKIPSLLLLAVLGKSKDCVELLVKKKAAPYQDDLLAWDEEHFRIPHHFELLGLGLMNSGILALPFDRIPFNTRISKSEFQRNVREKLRDFLRRDNRTAAKDVQCHTPTTNDVCIL